MLPKNYYSDYKCPKDSCFADKINATQAECRHCGNIFSLSQAPAQAQAPINGLSPAEIAQVKNMSPQEKQNMVDSINARLAESSPLVMDARIRAGEIDPPVLEGPLEADAKKRQEEAKRRLKDADQKPTPIKKQPGTV